MTKGMKLLSAVLVLALNVNAAEKKADAKAATKAAAVETMKVDVAASTAGWKGTKKVGGGHEGSIKIQSGEITVEKNMIKGGEFTFDMKSITDADLKDETLNKKLVGHLSSPDFFNVEKFPTATFKITSVAAGKAKDEMIVKGDLTMIGNTQPVEFPAVVKFDKGQAMGTATVKFDRTKWGLKYGSGNFFKELALDKIVNDEIELKLNLTAKK